MSWRSRPGPRTRPSWRCSTDDTPKSRACSSTRKASSPKRAHHRQLGRALSAKTTRRAEKRRGCVACEIMFIRTSPVLVVCRTHHYDAPLDTHVRRSSRVRRARVRVSVRVPQRVPRPRARGPRARDARRRRADQGGAHPAPAERRSDLDALYEKIVGETATLRSSRRKQRLPQRLERRSDRLDPKARPSVRSRSASSPRRSGRSRGATRVSGATSWRF